MDEGTKEIDRMMIDTTPEPVYTPVLPPTPAQLSRYDEAQLRLAHEVGGAQLLSEWLGWILREKARGARSPGEVAALRRWVEIEHRTLFLEWRLRLDEERAGRALDPVPA